RPTASTRLRLLRTLPIPIQPCDRGNQLQQGNHIRQKITIAYDSCTKNFAHSLSYFYIAAYLG
ncbi:hypothetical protein, partial [Cohnella sp. REN36]|uniref:hypothetical protein n=1 Tax=Cohnella sp. REN36 TaxID=2887347 RepID=UPI001D14C992